MKRTLVTGAAGFIGFHLSSALLKAGHKVTGLDNMNDYYDVSLKKARLARLQNNDQFEFLQADIENRGVVRSVIQNGLFDTVVNLAAQAGVRYSLTHPEAYVRSNLTGFFNVLDACKEYAVPHLVYASSSSVYGANTQLPFSEQDKTETPVSL
jgi:UDP-glucuronate 4-epimerase